MFGRGNRFSLLQRDQTGSEAQPASYLRGTGGCFAGVGVKWPGRKNDRSSIVPRLRMSGAIPPVPVHLIIQPSSPRLNLIFCKESIQKFYTLSFCPSFSPKFTVQHTLKSQVFWDMTPCRFINSYRHFGEVILPSLG
jgi:hypothetical protein